MKGNEKLISVLNKHLSEELSAVNQYMVHSEMCGNWGYKKLHLAIRKQAMDEMHHAEWLIKRIIFLNGSPNVSKLNAIKTSKSVPEMIKNDKNNEHDAVHMYNSAIALAHEVGDEGTANLLTKILKMEEGHVDWAESQDAQIEQMGLENYLATQNDAMPEDSKKE